MKIKSITLERFKKFEKTEILLGDLNILAGPNNSGKSTILWAIKIFFYFVHKSLYLKNNAIDFKNHYVHAMDFIPLPVDDELWFNKKSGKQDAPVTITIEFDNNWLGKLKLTSMFGQIHVSFESSKIPADSSAEKIEQAIKKEVAYIPGVVGVLVQESYSTPARQISLAAEGRYAEIFRSALLRLTEDKSGSLAKINSFLKANLNVELLKPQFNPEKNEFIISRYRDLTKKEEFDIVACGSGFHQIIQIFVNLLLKNPQIVLFDEPDAHLHPSIQGSLASAMDELRNELKAQILVATHSYDIIDYFDISNILLINTNTKRIEPLKSKYEVQEELTQAGIISNSALVKLFAAKNTIVLEDEIIDIFRGFDRQLKTKICKNCSLRSAKGVSKFGNQKEIVDATAAIIGSKINPIFVQDRDGLPNEYINDLELLARQDDIKIIFIDRHEIENYLLEPILIMKVLKQSVTEITIEDVKTLILEVIKENKSEWNECIRKRAKHINNELKRLKNRNQKTEKVVITDVDNFIDSADLNFKKLIALYPGKEMLRALRLKITNKYKISFSNNDLINITDGRTSKDLKNVLNKILKQFD